MDEKFTFAENHSRLCLATPCLSQLNGGVHKERKASKQGENPYSHSFVFMDKANSCQLGVSGDGVFMRHRH